MRSSPSRMTLIAASCGSVLQGVLVGGLEAGRGGWGGGVRGEDGVRLLPLGLECRTEVKGQKVPVCLTAAAVAG